MKYKHLKAVQNMLHDLVLMEFILIIGMNIWHQTFSGS